MLRTLIKRLPHWKITVRLILTVAVVIFCIRVLYKETKENKDHRDDILKTIARVEESKHFSPILVLVRREYYPFASVTDKIKEHDGQRFGMVVDTFDPTVSMNYFVYPKELYMSVETQVALIHKLLAKSEEKIPHKRPANVEFMAAFDPRHGFAIEKEWAGFQ